MQLTELEQHIFHILNRTDVPAPKFQLFQQTNRGIIVGIRWCSVDVGFYEGMEPGWWYAINQGRTEIEVTEDLLNAVEDDAPVTN